MTLQCVDSVIDSGRQSDPEWPVAGMEIPLGSYLAPVPDIQILPIPADFPGADDNVVKIYSENGRLTSENENDTWAQRLPAARDLHEQNVVVYRGGDGHVCIRTTQAVAPGVELRGWYGEGLAMELNIPHLTPAHIRGVQKYRCNRCMEVFAFPNLLKLHLMSRCDVQSTCVSRCDVNSTCVSRCGVNSTCVSRCGVNSTYVSRCGVNSTCVSQCGVNSTCVSQSGVYSTRVTRCGVNSTCRSLCSNSPMFISPRAVNSTSTSPSSVNSPLFQEGVNLACCAMIKSSLTNQTSPSMPGADYKLSLQYQTRQPASPEQSEKTTVLRLFPFMNILSPSHKTTTEAGEKDSSGPFCVNAIQNPNIRPFILKNTTQHSTEFTPINCKLSCKFEPYLVRAAVGTVPHDHTVRSRLGGMLEERARLPSRFDHLSPAASSRFSESPEGTLEDMQKSFIELTTGKGHMCVYCGKFYSRKYGLKIHLRTHTGYKPLKCKICLRAFGDPSNLNKHVRLHADGNTPYTCPHCGKVLVRRRDLVRHVRSRHSAIGIHSPEPCSVE